jgi:hypothetical protein
VYRTLWQADFARSPVIRLLFGVRGRMHARLEDFPRTTVSRTPEQ